MSAPLRLMSTYSATAGLGMSAPLRLMGTYSATAGFGMSAPLRMMSTSSVTAGCGFRKDYREYTHANGSQREPRERHKSVRGLAFEHLDLTWSCSRYLVWDKALNMVLPVLSGHKHGLPDLGEEMCPWAVLSISRGA